MNKKIGIISELNYNNANYGNRLQAYALNQFIKENFTNNVTSLVVNQIDNKRKTLNNVIKFFYKIFNYKFHIDKKTNIKTRIKECNLFTDLIKSKEYSNIDDITKDKYDIFLVGSDVVWAQFHGGVDEMKFLNFGKNNFKKISYAASFGKNWIPNENKKIIEEDLSKFNMISVREQSAIKLLNKIGIENVEHVCDPTLLLSDKEWKNIEKKVDMINQKYIFTYLLGNDKRQKKKIKSFANKQGLKIVNIPFANGIYNKIDKKFGDINVDNCSPQEWLWLIDNAEYIFTDSFHGTIFSTIFEKKFIVVNRKSKNNINIRMLDYLETISQKDKFINDFDNISNLSWNYDEINKKKEKFKIRSIDFLNRALKEERK